MVPYMSSAAPSVEPILSPKIKKKPSFPCLLLSKPTRPFTISNIALSDCQVRTPPPSLKCWIEKNHKSSTLARNNSCFFSLCRDDHLSRHRVLTAFFSFSVSLEPMRIERKRETMENLRKADTALTNVLFEHIDRCTFITSNTHHST